MPDDTPSSTQIPSFNITDKTNFNIDIPFVPFGPLYENELTKQYSKHIQRFIDKKGQLTESLRKMIPDIKYIDIDIDFSSYPILMVAENGKNSLSPLASYGDGTIKLFRILLSLFATNHYYDRLMIDELDAGIHYSRISDFLKSLLLVSTDQKKQIFATTHSKECIEGFTKALEETGMQNEGRIIRLAETKQGIKAFTMEFDEFENALLAESEIR
jgi:AAA15 family ATPase/GTPase